MIAVHRRDLPRATSRRCGGDVMTEAWISLPSGIERVRAHEGLSTGAANVRAIEAFASGQVRTRWESLQGSRGGEAGTRPAIGRHAWAGADIPEPDLMVSADGTRRRGITVNEADLTAWLNQFCREKKPVEAASPIPAGVHTTKMVLAEDKCGDLLEQMPREPRPKKDDLRKKARVEIMALSDAAFNRQWAKHAPAKGWTARGAFPKTPKP
jgi:hypothetical protein